MRATFNTLKKYQNSAPETFPGRFCLRGWHVKQPRQFRAPWEKSKPDVRREHDLHRGSSASRGYGAEWRRARIDHLNSHPLCVCCLANGVVHPATMVDHVVPHRGDMEVFWNRKDWQSLCDWCHKAIKSSVEYQWSSGKLGQAALRLDRIHIDWRAPTER